MGVAHNSTSVRPILLPSPSLLWCAPRPQSEYVYHVFGQHKFGKITTNLDRFLRRFNAVQFWVVTEVCRIDSLQSRVRVVSKFIKVANQ